jgi:uncharacterized protein (DUF2235 family)
VAQSSCRQITLPHHLDSLRSRRAKTLAGASGKARAWEELMTDRAKRIVLCLDGTWNRPYQAKERDDGSEVLKPSNPLKVCRAVLPHDPATPADQITYYDIGVGALSKYPGTSNTLLRLSDNVLGGAWGAGFEANIEDAATFLVHNYRADDQVYVFGFSRGAAQARGLTRFLDWLGGLPAKGDAYFMPLFFRHYITTSGQGEPGDVTTATGHRPDEPLVPVVIEFLGVWDTVMALGSRFRASRGTSVGERSFHVGEKPAQCVRHARQALAIDEQRYDFRPEVWLGHSEGQTLEQRWFPGVHSNVGGGYVKDGLANLSLRWLLDEAARSGLATDREFTKHYRPYPQAKLYQSKTRLYRVLEAVRLRRNRGIRSLEGFPSDANLLLDKSAVHRMLSDPGEHEQLDAYEPKNVAVFLRARPDLSTYLASIGIDVDDPGMPPGTLERLGRG